jgi:polyhydroxyalkanoate synthase
LASSGHIAGIINPPGGKGIYWVNAGDRPADTPEEWRASSTRHDGSWWTDWARWLAEHSGCEGNPPAMGSAVHPALDDAPGRNVLEK